MFNRKEQRNGQGEIRQRLQGAGGHPPEDARQFQGFCGPLCAFAKAGPRACRPGEKAHGPIVEIRVELWKGLEVEMSENLAEHYAPSTPREVEDEIAERRPIVTAH